MAFAKIILNNEVLMDVTSDTVEASKLLSTYTATKNDGTKISGSYVPPSPVISSLTVTPTESAQTFNAGAVSGYKPVTVNAISSNYVGTGVTTRSSADLTANGSTITAPAGYYATAATKNVEAGSAVPPAVTITMNPTVTIASATGIVTATYTGSSSITPTVTAGYISQGTAGTISTTGTKTLQLTSKAAATINTSTADQTIASYRWLTGTQTIKSVTTSNLTAANIKSGVVVKVGDANNASRITQITGTYNPQPTISALTVTPTETAQTFNATAVSGYKPVTVNAISSNYVGTAISLISNLSKATISTTYTSSSVTFKISNYYVESGYYSQSLLLGDTGLTVNLFSESVITPSSGSQNIYGARYLSGKLTIEAIPSAYIIPSGTSNITSNGTYDIASYQSISVSVAGESIEPFITRTISGVYSNSTFTTIGSGAFMGMYSITSVNFPNASIISSYAFYYCSKLVSAYIPKITSIPAYAFYSCSVLRSLITSELSYVDSYAFYLCKNLPNLNWSLITYVGEAAFQGCHSLTTLDAPLINTVGMSAFAMCYSLSTASIPSVSLINSAAFLSTGLKSIYCPNVTSIKDNTFQNCTLLRSIDLPSVTSIGTKAFYSAGLSSISMPNVTFIGSSAFASCKSLTGNLDLPSLTTLFEYAFQQCKLTSIYCPKLTNIPVGAFSGNTSMTSISFPSCTKIDNYAFSANYLLSGANISKCSSIGVAAFSTCSALSWVHVSTSEAGIIGSYAFWGCRTLMSVYLFNTYGLSIMQLMSSNAFGNTAITNSGFTGSFGSIYVFSSYYSKYITADQWSYFSSRFVSLTTAEINAIAAQLT